MAAYSLKSEPIASVLALISLTIAGLLTPQEARAGDVCELNGIDFTGSATADGTNSLACGRQAFAGTANNNTAIGTNSSAIQDSAVAIGYGSLSGDFISSTGPAAYFDPSLDTSGATAVGTAATAAGASSTAVGDFALVGVATPDASTPGLGTISEVDAGTAVGGHATVTAVGGVALGSYSTASGVVAIAIGLNSVGSGTNSIAIGQYATADATESIAIGYQSTTNGFTNSVALGSDTHNTANNQIALGGQTAATARNVTGVAPGVISATSFDAVNGSQLFATNQNVAANTTAITAIQTSDTSQNNRLTALETSALTLGDAIDRVDDRASGGTAVAIALGGNGFLPNHNFNLTGNVGIYRGKAAAAIQVGAMLSPNAAFNAGIATSFNHDGKLGARAGFAIGF